VRVSSLLVVGLFSSPCWFQCGILSVVFHLFLISLLGCLRTQLLIGLVRLRQLEMHPNSMAMFFAAQPAILAGIMEVRARSKGRKRIKGQAEMIESNPLSNTSVKSNRFNTSLSHTQSVSLSLCISAAVHCQSFFLQLCPLLLLLLSDPSVSLFGSCSIFSFFFLLLCLVLSALFSLWLEFVLKNFARDQIHRCLLITCRYWRTTHRAWGSGSAVAGEDSSSDFGGWFVLS
jgi:hypothetical protein